VQLNPGYTVGEAVTFLQTEMTRLNSGLAYKWDGTARDYLEAGSSVGLAFGLALLLVFLVLAAQFESWIHPAIIILAAPLAAAGGLMALRITGQTLNVYSNIGLIMLIGLVAKNGILMVEFANQLRDRGESVLDAIRHAARVRLRPILMTSIATIAGSIPLAVAHGAGAEGRMAIGTVIIGGLTAATGLTLFIIPTLYAYLARFTRPAGTIARELSRLETEHPPKPVRPEPPLS
jgi:multidrug efflux pump